MSPEVIFIVTIISSVFTLAILFAIFFSLGWLTAKFKRRTKLRWSLLIMVGGIVPLAALWCLPRLAEDKEDGAEIRS